MKDTATGVGSIDRRGFIQLAAAGAGLAGGLSAAIRNTVAILGRSTSSHSRAPAAPQGSVAPRPMRCVPRYNRYSISQDLRWSKPLWMSMKNPPNPMT
jgi:hypothetical protein